MTDQSEQIDPELINDYVDGELDAETRLMVERYLEAHPDERERVTIYRAQSSALRDGYASVLNEPIPDALMDVIDRNWPETPPTAATQPRKPRPMPPLAWAASAVLALAIGGATGWFVRGDAIQHEAQRLAMEMFLEEALNSYAMYANEDSPWHEAGALNDRDAFGEWFKDERELDVPIPDLGDEGYSFVGGRALPSSGGEQSGQMIYKNDDGEMVALHFQYRDRGDGDPSVQAAAMSEHSSGQFLERDELSVYYWSDDSGSSNYALLGPLDQDGLKSLGEKLLDQFR